MRYRRFGRTDLTVSEVGFGCARIGGVFQRSTSTELVRLLRRAFDEGITFFDTADMYAQGESERLVGTAFHDRRDRVVIASKGGYVLPTQRALVSRIKPILRPVVHRLGLKRHLVASSLRGTIANQDFSPAYLTNAVEASLRRLRTDYLDLYQLHAPCLDVLGRGDFVETLEQLRQQGKLRHWGVACDGPEHVLGALGLQHLDAVQVSLSALEPAALDSAIPRAASHDVAVIARQVFASGLLTRDLQSIAIDQLDSDPHAARVKYERLHTFASVASHTNRTHVELALQYSLAQAGVSTVLVGISRAGQLDELVRALQAPPLTSDESDSLRISSELHTCS